MKQLPLTLLCFQCCLCSLSQDTVIIKSIKFYEEGKVNVLKSPSGKKTIVTLMPIETDWKDPKDVDTSFYWDKQRRKLRNDLDTTMPTPLPLPIMALGSSILHYPFLPKSYIDPSLTDAQKAAIKANECQNSKFAGQSRAKVKTSIVTGNRKTYNTLLQFLNTLPSDVDMEVVIDALDKPWQDRAIQEEKNVPLKNIFLKAYNRERDNDYHLILCDQDQTIFFNAEVSALPSGSASSFQTIKKVRIDFETFPGEKKCGGTYVKFATPIKIIKMKGPIFFDTDHAAGQIGPKGFRPKTAWEIHPITFLKFE